MISNKDLLELEKNKSKNEIESSPFLINATKTNSAPPTKPNFSKIQESSVLSRVRDFLPKLKEANIDLKKKIENQEDVNIENIKEGEEYIQMNLALGILEHKEELNENNIKISNDNNNNNNNKKPIVDLDDKNNNIDNNSKKRKQPNNKPCTNNNNNNNINNLEELIKNSQDLENSKNILEILNTPASVIDKFGLILDNDSADDSDFENEEQLEPLEVNY